MSSQEMTSLINKRKSQLKKKKNQIPIAGLLLVVSLALCVLFNSMQQKLTVYWIAGIAIGIVLRYSRFCFAAAFRDPFLIGSTKLLRGIIIALMVSTVGFAAIHSKYIESNTIEYDQIPGAVSSVGIHVIIGAFLFGIGMVIAGGCASSVLMRIGEGHALQVVVLVGFIIGTLLGAKNYDFWYEHIIRNAKTIYFLEYFDLRVVVVVQIIVLAVLYRLAVLYEKKKSNKV